MNRHDRRHPPKYEPLEMQWGLAEIEGAKKVCCVFSRETQDLTFTASEARACAALLLKGADAIENLETVQ